MILMIDNYDSFVYNLYQYFLILGADVEVVRNDQITIAQIERKNPEAIVISPGPCSPKEAGVSVDVIKYFLDKKPMLGICLGHQCLGYALGGNVIRAGQVMHGKTSMVKHNQKGIFSGIENPFEAMRYHSLVVEDKTLPNDLEITAISQDDGEIMGLQHKRYPVYSMQFHPESIMTNVGMDILNNFLNLIGS